MSLRDVTLVSAIVWGKTQCLHIHSCTLPLFDMYLPITWITRNYGFQTHIVIILHLLLVCFSGARNASKPWKSVSKRIFRAVSLLKSVIIQLEYVLIMKVKLYYYTMWPLVKAQGQRGRWGLWEISDRGFMVWRPAPAFLVCSPGRCLFKCFRVSGINVFC